MFSMVPKSLPVNVAHRTFGWAPSPRGTCGGTGRGADKERQGETPGIERCGRSWKIFNRSRM